VWTRVVEHVKDNLVHIAKMDIEARLCAKLHELSELNKRLGELEDAGFESRSLDAEDPIESEVEAVITEAQSLLDQLQASISTFHENDDGSAATASQRVRYRGLMDVHSRESAALGRLSKSARHKIENAHLMAGVWKKNGKDMSSVEHLLRERSRYDVVCTCW